MNTGKIFIKSIKKSFDNRLLETSGYVAYTGIISFFPFMILLISVASLFDQAEQTQKLIYLAQIHFPPEIVKTVLPIIDSLFEGPRLTLVTFSIIGLIWAPASGLESLRFGLNNAFELNESRSFFNRYAQNLLTIFIVLTLIIVVGLIFLIIPILYQYAPQIDGEYNFVHTVIRIIHFLEFNKWVDFSLYIALVGAVFACLYYFLPNLRSPVGPIFPGAFLAALLFVLFSGLFSYYIENFADYVSIYKAFAGVVILLLFIQFSAYIFLLGAQFNNELSFHRNCEKS